MHSAGMLPNVQVNDTDLGVTGSSTAGCPGFQELVTCVNLGQVGIIFAYDVTRLARNCTDWYQLLDLCGFRQCLVGDQEAVYDPATPNGRLILGLKGLIAELELHTIKTRMHAGLINKAGRGELAMSLPVGLGARPVRPRRPTPGSRGPRAYCLRLCDPLAGKIDPRRGPRDGGRSVTVAATRTRPR